MSGGQRRIFVVAKGGLGNQLFQYSFGYNLSRILGAELVIEGRLSYWREPFGRKLELQDWVDVRTTNVIQSGRLAPVVRFPWLTTRPCLVTDDTLKLGDRDIQGRDLRQIQTSCRDVVANGYWQSAHYFSESRSQIMDRLNSRIGGSNEPPFGLDRTELNRAAILGVRTYSESIADHEAFTGRLNSRLERINHLLRRIRNHGGIRNLIVICLEDPHFLNQLDWQQERITPLIGSEGYPTPELWRLFRFVPIHIMFSSTFFWWASFLSTPFTSTHERYVVGRMHNTNVLPPGWHQL